MIKKMSRQKCLEKFKLFPHCEEKNILSGESFFYPQSCGTYTLTHKSKTFDERAGLIGNAIASLTEEYGLGALLFMPNEDSAWIKDPGDNVQAMEAIDFLLSHNVEPGFDGCLIVNVAVIAEFFKHIMILSHYVEDYPMINYSEEGMIFIASICSHGMHVDILNTDVNILAKDSMEATTLDVFAGDVCETLFNDLPKVTAKDSVKVKVK